MMINPFRPEYGTQAPGTPSTFAPSVAEGDMPMTPASAPYVSPMRNSAPGLLKQTGETLAQAGEVESKQGNTIGDRVQATMDEASTKAAENQFLQSSLPLLAQYKTTEGMNATQQFDPTAQAIVKARQDARAPLTNPIQQRMFDQVTNDHLLTFGAQMADHESTQRVQYGKQQGNDRADSMNVLARMAYLNGDMAGYGKYSQQADAETLNVAQLSGAAPDSDVAQAMLRTKRGSLAQGVVAGLLDKHAYNEAGDYFAKMQGNLDTRTSEVLGNAIKSVTQQEETETNGQKAIMAAKGVTGPGVLQAPVPGATIATTVGADGIDIHAAQGTPVHAPASGTITKVWTDEKNGGGLTVEMTLPGGYTAAFNHLSAANYTAGQKITVGQVLGLTGKDESGQGVMQYSMTDADGKFTDPRQAGSAPMDPRNFNSPDDEEKAVNWINANISDPEGQRRTERYVRGIADLNRQIENQEHTAAVKQATDYWFQNGQSIAGLPADVKMKLTPADLDSFIQQTKARNDVNVLANWIEHPERMTVDAVRQAHAQGELSDSGYLTALRQATNLQGGDSGNTDPQKVRQATIDHDQLTDVFAVNQLPHLAYPKNDGDRTSRVEMETAIKSEIDLQQQRNNRTLSWQEKGKIARDMVIDKVYTPGFFGPGDPKPVATLTPEEQQKATVYVGQQKVRMMDIPPKYALQATQDLQANQVPTTQANIAAWWLKKGSPKQ